MSKLRIASILIILLSTLSCQRELETAPGTAFNLRVTFENKVDTSNMQLGKTYINGFSESYTISMFKYYISNIILFDGGAINRLPVSYHLVNEADSNSKSFVVSVDKSHYTGISFLVGVDSARNVSGTQTGDLDPAEAMFWTWSTGYIMAKLEGVSPLAAVPNNKVELHIGGFKTGENATRIVTLNLPAANAIDIKENGTSEIIIQADANAWFKGVHDLKIASNPVCATPGQLAGKFADNYANMFKVVTVIN